MFEAITRKRKNPVFNFIGWTLLIVVCLIFVFVGFAPDTSFLGASGAVAEVNGEVITMQQFRRYFDRAISGNKKKMTRKEREQTQGQVVESLVSRALIQQAASEEEVLISDRQVAEIIKQEASFQEDGQFSLARYKEVLRANAGLSESRFEGQIRSDLTVQKMYGYYTQGAVDAKILKDTEKQMKDFAMNLKFLKLPKVSLLRDDKLDPAALASFVKENQKDIEEYYKKNVATEFTVPEQVKAQHILVKTSDKKTAEQALKEVQKIKSEITEDNFAELAKKYSEDSGSKTRGGDLGFFPKGRMVKEFEKVAFESEPGTVSEPVKTSFGYHIIKVNEKKKPSVKPLEEASAGISKKLYKESRGDQVVDEIKKKVKEGDAAFAAYAKSMGWKWQETGFFSLEDLTIPKIGDSDEALKEAMTLTKSAPLSVRPFESNGNVILLKLVDYDLNGKKTPPKKFNMDFFQQYLQQQRTNEMFEAWISQMKESATVKINTAALRQ